MKKHLFRNVLMISTILPSFSFAARPFTVDDAGTVPGNNFEIEVASDFWKKKAALGQVLKHGITDKMDIGLALGYTALPSIDRSVDPLEISFKYAFIPELLSGSVSSIFSYNTWVVNLIISRSVGFLTLHGNIGVEATAHEDNAQINWGIASMVTTGRFTSGLEVTGTHEKAISWLAGTQISLLKWLAFDIGLSSQFQHLDDFTLTSGLLFTF